MRWFNPRDARQLWTLRKVKSASAGVSKRDINGEEETEEEDVEDLTDDLSWDDM